MAKASQVSSIFQGRALVGLCLALFWILAMPAASSATNLSVDDRLAQSHKALADDHAEALKLYQALLRDYANLSQEEQWKVDFLGAKVHYLEGNTTSGVKALKELSQRPLPNSLAIEVNTYLAGAYALSNDFDLAFETLNKAVSQLEPTTEEAVEMETVVRAASLYEQAGGYEDAMQYAKRLENLASPSANLRYLCRAQYLMAKSEWGNQHFAEADRYFDTAVKTCTRAMEANFVKLAEHDMARNWLDQGRTDEALALLERLKASITPENYWAIGVADNKYLLTIAYWKQGRWQDVIKAGADALSFAQSIHYPVAIKEASRALGLSYAQVGRYQEAYKYLLIHLDAAKNVTDEAQARFLAYQRAQYDLREKARKIEQLEHENRLLALEQALQSSERQILILMISVGSIVVLFLAFALVRSRTQRTQFRKLAETDTLTDISNRHHIIKAGEMLLKECSSRGTYIGIIMFDLDHFKDINDRYGHPVGDWVLRHVAAACKRQLRKGDILGRFGGEEFIVILQDISPKSLLQMAERFRETIATLDSTPTGKEFSITASFGVTYNRESKPPSLLSDLIKQADEALYSAKQAGRDQVAAYGDGVA